MSEDGERLYQPLKPKKKDRKKKKERKEG